MVQDGIGKSCDIYVVELLKLMQGHANYAGIVWVKVLNAGIMWSF